MPGRGKGTGRLGEGRFAPEISGIIDGHELTEPLAAIGMFQRIALATRQSTGIFMIRNSVSARHSWAHHSRSATRIRDTRIRDQIRNDSNPAMPGRRPSFKPRFVKPRLTGVLLAAVAPQAPARSGHACAATDIAKEPCCGFGSRLAIQVSTAFVFGFPVEMVLP